jgi:hypothetical protein
METTLSTISLQRLTAGVNTNHLPQRFSAAPPKTVRDIDKT